MLRWHLRGIAEPAERIAQARALLGAVAAAGEEGDELRRRLAWQAEWALAQSDPALYHDELADHHDAVLFSDFAAHAARHGLQFLAEADVFEMETGALPGELRDAGLLEREQYLDFFKGRMFRQTLLCHADVERRDPGPDVVRGLLAATAAKPEEDDESGRVRFRGPHGATLTTDHEGVKRALVRLGEAWPAALPVAELDGEGVGEALLRAYAVNLVQPARVGAGTRDRAVRAARGERAGAAAGRRGLARDHPAPRERRGRGRARPPADQLLDGSRDRAALLRELGRPAAELERSLEGLARLALLER